MCPKLQKDSHVLLKNIHKSFDRHTALLSDLTIEIKKGEFFSLLGPSGCGKTTILRMIAGLERPDNGTITIGNIKVSGDAWVPPEKRGVGIVFQDYALFPHMTVFKNVAFGLKGYSRQAIKKRVMEMLEMVNLADMSRRYPHELSGGQQQRVALARALAPSPKVLLLDEPFSNLDADLRLDIRTETKRILKEKGTTTIIVTHDKEEALYLSDRVAILHNGRFEQVGAPDEVYRKPATRLSASFIGRSDFMNKKVEKDSVISDIEIKDMYLGETAEITSMGADDEAIRCLCDMGIREGKLVDLLHCDLTESKKIVIQVDNSKIAFDEKLACNIKVKPIKSHYEALEAEAVYDHLTGCLNRRSMERILMEEHEKFMLNKIPFSVFLADIDYFKRINDTYGHGAGDNVLKDISALFKQVLRRSDCLCRWGGEEFLILLRGTRVNDAIQTAERIRVSVEHHIFQPFSGSGFVTVSLGGSGLPPSNNVSVLIETADSALYAAKNNGRNRVHICEV